MEGFISTWPVPYDELLSLFEAWIHAEVRWIGETSGNFERSYTDLVDMAKSRAAALNIQWTDDFVPEIVVDTLERWERGWGVSR